MRRYAEGQLIVTQGERGDTMYFLERGAAQAEVAATGAGGSETAAPYTGSSKSGVVMRCGGLLRHECSPCSTSKDTLLN